MPQPQIILGSYTSDGNPRNLEIPFCHVGSNIRVELYNRTNFASVANPGVVKRAWWQNDMADASWIGVVNTDGAATDETAGSATAGGFTLIDTNQTNQLEAAVTGTALTKANPAVAAANAHGYAVGDILQITQTTDMLQVAGIDFEVTAVGDANHYTLGFLDSSGFAAAATAITSRRLRYEDIFAPRKRYITNITKAAQAVVTFSVSHGYQVGEVIRFNVSDKNGMQEIDNLQGEITAINTTNNTATVDINSTGFTTFDFPTSAEAAKGYTPAHTVPVGENGILTAATHNSGFAAIHLGSSVVGASSDIVDFRIELGYSV